MKNFIEWNKELSVDIQELDEQHKVLVDILNRLHEAIITRTDTDIIDDIFTELVQYTLVHFAVEESLMRIFDYPLYEDHKKHHEQLTKQVIDLQRKARKGDITASMSLWQFLKKWLTNHILIEDKKYSLFFLKCGLKKHWTERSWSGKIWDYIRS